MILIPQWLLAADWVACGSHYSHFRAAQDITSSSLHVYKRRRKHRSSTCLSVYLTPSAFHDVAHAQLLHFLCPCGLPLMEKTRSLTPPFLSCSSVYQPLVIWEVGFPGGTAQVAVMSLARSASRTICPSFCPHFIYVMAHLVNSRLPATHLLITACWHSFNLFL